MNLDDVIAGTILWDIECLPSQINQVIVNIVVNAAHAIDTCPLAPTEGFMLVWLLNGLSV